MLQLNGMGVRRGKVEDKFGSMAKNCEKNLCRFLVNRGGKNSKIGDGRKS
jgi:hypothetical protein